MPRKRLRAERIIRKLRVSREALQTNEVAQSSEMPPIHLLCECRQLPNRKENAFRYEAIEKWTQASEAQKPKPLMFPMLTSGVGAEQGGEKAICEPRQRQNFCSCEYCMLHVALRPTR